MRDIPSIDFEGNELEGYTAYESDTGRLIVPFALDRSTARRLADRHHRRTGRPVYVQRFYWDQRYDTTRLAGVVFRRPVTGRLPRRVTATA